MHSRSGGSERVGVAGASVSVWRYLLAAALLYTVFVIYGSLVPLEYRALPFAEALQRFRAIRWLDLGIGSRADWVANILLFIPLAFLWLGVLWHRRSAALRMAATLLVFLAAVVLSFAIEFTQLYFPQRTVSQNDLLAEALGALGGIVAWWTIGPRAAAWCGEWIADRGERSPWQRLLYVYLVPLFAYNLLPLDLTISPVEIYHKFSEGRLVLLPFTGLPSDAVQGFYEIMTDVAIWIPAALLWRASGATTASAVRRTVALALVLECLQLFVYSRVSDVTDVLSALLGGWLGAGPAARLLPVAHVRTAPAGARHDVRAFVLSLLGVIGCCAVLAAVFWYPFDFNTDANFLRERVAMLRRAPFTSYYYGTEFRAVTSALQKILFFLPLGFLLACALTARGWRRGWIRVTALGVAALVAGLIEGAQLALPDKVADLTDWALATAGAAAGIALAIMILKPGSTRWSR